MSFKYTYTKEVVLGRLELEIRASTGVVHDLDYMTSLGTTVDIYFKAELSPTELTVLDAIVAAHVPTPLPVENQTVDIEGIKSSQGHLIVEMSIPTGPAGSRSVSLATPDLSDRTCWYQKSVKVTDEVLVNSGDWLTFTSSHIYWVDIYHPKLTYTHKQIPTRTGAFGRHSDWATIVLVDSVVQSPDAYSIDFAAGSVTFKEPQTDKIVTCAYWHTDGVDNPSEWLLLPPAGKKFIVEHTELQVSVGITINDTLRFEIWAGANLASYGTFSDTLFEAGYGQLRADYRNANDFLNATNLGQGAVPKIGNLTRETVILPFNYIQAFALDSAVGAIFRLTLVNDTPYTNTDIATGTFYLQIV